VTGCISKFQQIKFWKNKNSQILEILNLKLEMNSFINLTIYPPNGVIASIDVIAFSELLL